MKLKNILAVVSVLAVLGVCVPCENFNVLNDFNVSVSAENSNLNFCGESVTCNFNESTGILTISGTGDMYEFNIMYFEGVGIDCNCPWYSYKNNIKSVIIENGVTNIGQLAFSGCTSLTSITIPDSVTSIDWFAFNNCTSLASVTIPDSVVSIGFGAFENTPFLENQITDVKYIKKWAVDCNENATEVEIEEGTVVIVNSTFYNCMSLKSVTIPNSVKIIEYSAFINSNSLTDVYFQGTQEEWNSIEIDNTDESNTYLLNATIHFLGENEQLKGDVNGDGKITSNDALNILQFVANVGELTEEQKALADLDDDGEVTALDALKLLYMIVGLE